MERWRRRQEGEGRDKGSLTATKKINEIESTVQNIKCHSLPREFIHIDLKLLN